MYNIFFLESTWAPNLLEQKFTEFKLCNTNIFPVWQREKKLSTFFPKGQGISTYSRKSSIQQDWLNWSITSLKLIKLIYLGITFADSGSEKCKYIFSKRLASLLQLACWDPSNIESLVSSFFCVVGIPVSLLPHGISFHWGMLQI